MEKVIHRSESRGLSDHGWLKACHTFSYGNYYDPRRVHFGALRVFNDNTIQGGEGFGSHPNDNIEIVLIPLKGAIDRSDSLGNISILYEGEVAVISAGTGIIHNMYNRSADEPVSFLKIWFFPDEYEIPPAYSQAAYGRTEPNELKLIVCPVGELPSGADNVAGIHQSVWIYRSALDEGSSVRYDMHRETDGAYVFVIDGEIEIDGSRLKSRDGIGIWDAANFEIKASQPSSLLIIEVPMRKS